MTHHAHARHRRPAGTAYADAARDHLWMHFTRHSTYERRRARARHRARRGRLHLGRPAARRTSTGWPGCSWSRSGTAARSWPRRPPSRPRSWRSSRCGPTPTRARSTWPSGSPAYAPGDLNRVFFTTGGGEAVETAWKLAKQYFKLTGKPTKHKVISRVDRLPRHPAGRAVDHRHPGGQGDVRAAGAGRASRCPTPTPTAPPSTCATTRRRSGCWAADRIEEAIEFEGPDTVAAVFLEPVQNSGGCFPPPPGYFERVREICDEYDVLLVSDEVICAFGRIGSMFACDDFGYVPDIITCAKGMTSGYSPIGAMIASDRLFEPFKHGHDVRSRTATPSAGTRCRPRWRWPTSTSSSARASTSTCKENAPAFRATLEKLLDLPIVGDVRGDGLLLRHRAGQGQGDPGDVRRRREPSGCCAGSCPRRCSRPGCTAAPTTAATRSSSSPRR